jgi:hypothetical protein
MAASAFPDHPFVRKYALFSGGRWPLGVYRGDLPFLGSSVDSEISVTQDSSERIAT